MTIDLKIIKRPDFAFIIVWILVYILASLDILNFGYIYSVKIALLIISNCIGFLLIYSLCKFILNKKDKQIDEPNLILLEKLTKNLLVIWLILFVYIIYECNGIPIFWKIYGESKGYVDFYVPIFSGLMNLIRIIIFCNSIYLISKKFSWKYAIILTLIIISSLIELSRGNIIFLLLCGFGLAVTTFNIIIKLKYLLFTILFGILLFGYVESLRSPSSNYSYNTCELKDKITDVCLKYKITYYLPNGFIATYLYITTPIANLNYAETRGDIKPSNIPYYSIQGLIPSTYRDKIFDSKRKYPILIKNEVFNATTFYSPLLADFDYLWVFIIVTIIQLIISYIFIKANSGNFYYQLIYAPIYASLLLSFFYNYFLTQIIIYFIAYVFLLKIINSFENAE